MNKTEESLEVIFEMEEAGYSSEKEGCGYEINSDIDDVIDGDSVPATEPLKSYEEFSSLKLFDQTLSHLNVLKPL